jgi:hypothetical protein
LEGPERKPIGGKRSLQQKQCVVLIPCPCDGCLAFFSKERYLKAHLKNTHRTSLPSPL